MYQKILLLGRKGNLLACKIWKSKDSTILRPGLIQRFKCELGLILSIFWLCFPFIGKFQAHILVPQQPQHSKESSFSIVPIKNSEWHSCVLTGKYVHLWTTTVAKGMATLIGGLSDVPTLISGQDPCNWEVRFPRKTEVLLLDEKGMAWWTDKIYWCALDAKSFCMLSTTACNGFPSHLCLPKSKLPPFCPKKSDFFWSIFLSIVSSHPFPNIFLLKIYILNKQKGKTSRKYSWWILIMSNDKWYGWSVLFLRMSTLEG